jgi:radical SAM protein with 4Fe4S-binding SPASM domain
MSTGQESGRSEPFLLPRVPRSCFWEITQACNLRCIHCELSAGDAAPDELSTTEALALADALAELGCRDVQLTGGEPLVRPDWAVIAERLVQLGMNVFVISNGLRLGAPVVDRLVSLGVKGVSVSLDGSRGVHDSIRVPAHGSASSYDAVVAAITRLVASPLRTAVITQVHRGNLDDLPRMYAELVALGVDVWQVQICMPLGRLLKYREQYLVEPEQIASLQEQLAGFIRDGRLRIAVGDNIGYYGRHEPLLRGSVMGVESFWAGCIAGCQVIAICANGDVKGCPSHPREFVVGNIRQTPLGTIWREAERFAYNTRWDGQLLEGFCKTCPYRWLCRAGCTTMAYAVTGTIYDNPYCSQRFRNASPPEGAVPKGAGDDR